MTTQKFIVDAKNFVLSKKNLEKVGKHIVDRARLYADFNAGRKTKLGQSITYEVDPIRKIVRVKVGADWGGFVEFGTEPHIIRPKNKQALSWVHGGDYGHVQTKAGKTIRTGDKVTVKEVHHPGTQPAPFLRPAMEDAKKDIAKLLR